ncbi:MAG: UDP-glucose 4-epimerase GalE [Desulfovibrio sp.]|uniref:UDP-glucose 4-epimerase GalE n=1 Tax=Desulfovibrio sp. TaxID=885 RepID=UPI001A6C188C|nr:UDP-glucose 4-epimerase GalE [Desulfovibrio sp.]MBD5416666.1 UDP-glucose 4-epimerase GalE [Desulfovibrio sp.]
MAVLVCGGAGYIGSHNVRALLAVGRDVVVADNFLTGHRDAVAPQARLHELDIRDAAALDAVFAAHRIDAVLHFAASSLVGESMERPLDYFNNNILGMQRLLEAMQRHGVRRIVFSSSAAVYGEPDAVPIPEDAPLAPTNPYGESKRIMERIMHWAALAHGMRFVSLRYFNVGGAWPGGAIGEDHRPESHLIPLILQVPLGRRPHISIFGTDYPTPDGTCVRDYIDVMDLADAHLRALAHLERGGESLICNLGNGKGFSVREMIEAARRVTGHAIPVVEGPRRAGDPARLVASAELAESKLGWRPTRDIEAIIASAWEWHRTHPGGYGS